MAPPVFDFTSGYSTYNVCSSTNYNNTFIRLQLLYNYNYTYRLQNEFTKNATTAVLLIDDLAK